MIVRPSSIGLLKRVAGAECPGCFRVGRPGHSAPVIPTPRRRAFTVFEMGLAVILLAVAMTVSVQLLGWIAAERRAAERRRLAVREVANLMEHLAARPWDQLSPESVQSLKPTDNARAALPDAELAVNVDDRGAAAGGKRIAVRLRWRNRAGEWDAPVRLTTWVQQHGRPAP